MGATLPTAERVAALMPQLEEDLARLVAIPSVSAPGFPEPRRPLLDTYDLIVGLLRDAGVEKIDSLELPDTAPVIMGEIPAPDGAPTVLLYGHYDVVPAGRRDEVGVAAVRGDRARRRDLRSRRRRLEVEHPDARRGAARVGGKPPVGIKIVIEGQEEIGSAFGTFPPSRPGAVRRRRDGDRRHGQSPPRRPDAHDRACAGWRA